jgi:Frizzled/Smoothened family membrane region./Fz domain.
MCEEVKGKCEQHIRNYLNIGWPEVLNCDRLPKTNKHPNFCVPGSLTPTSMVRTQSPKNTKKTVKSNKPQTTLPPFRPPKIPDRKIQKTGLAMNEKYCKVLYSRNVKNYIFVEKIQSCALECMKNGLFTIEQKQLAERWISVLSCICGILCFASILCVCSNYNETTFPERTIFFIAVCYFFYVIGYVIRIVYSREGVTCQEENGRRYLLVDGSGNISCAATFLIAYCFSMVQSIWWVILCLTWFLSAGMRWTTEAIRSKSFIFHSLAWGIPCCKTVIVLVWRKIDINELTGICSIGNRYENLLALRWLVLGPLFVYLVMATMFLLFGLICLFRLQVHNEDQMMDRKKDQHLLLPIGSYAAVHTLFATFIVASYFYEYINKNSWYHDPKTTGPNFAVFLTRIISDFSIGISASIWLLLIHGPRIHRKMRVKLYQSDLLLPKDLSHRMPEHAKHYTSTNETSI